MKAKTYQIEKNCLSQLRQGRNAPKGYELREAIHRQLAAHAALIREVRERRERGSLKAEPESAVSMALVISDRGPKGQASSAEAAEAGSCAETTSPRARAAAEPVAAGPREGRAAGTCSLFCDQKVDLPREKGKVVAAPTPSSSPLTAYEQTDGAKAKKALAARSGRKKASEKALPATAASANGRETLYLSKKASSMAIREAPALESSRPLRRLFAHVAIGRRALKVGTLADGTADWRLSLGAKHLAAMEGRERQQQSGNYRGKDLLDQFALVAPGFEYDTHLFGDKNRPRTLRTAGLDLGPLVAELSVPVCEAGPLVKWDTLGSVEADRCVPELVQASLPVRRPKAELPRRLCAHLNGLPTRTFARMVKKNAGTAIQAVLAYAEEKGYDDHEVARQLHLVRLVQLQPKPFYQPSGRGRTCRVSATTAWALPALSGRVRRAFCAGCHDMDLANAHLALAASVWHLPLVEARLRSEGKIWPYLIGAVAGGREEAKGCLKDALYAAVYGMERENLWALVASELGSEVAEAFMTDPLIAELLDARDAKLAELAAAGWAEDVLGNEYVRPKGKRRLTWARSTLACLMQAMEMKLLEPVIDDAIRESERNSRPRYTIVAWQHDGFTIKARSEGDRIPERLQGLVARRAREMGVVTGLEVKLLPQD